MSSWGLRELFVTNVASDVTDEELNKLFGGYGENSVTVLNPKKGLQSASKSAIVKFSSHSAASAARAALNKSQLKGRSLTVRWSNSCLWVGSLHESVTNEVLASAFSTFGNVSRAVVVADGVSGKSRRYGYVEFEQKRDAERALQHCHDAALLVGQTGIMPVRIEPLFLEDLEPGFSEEARMGRSLPNPPTFDPTVVARFPSPGTSEHCVAMQLKELRALYDTAVSQLRHDMEEAEKRIIAGGGAPHLVFHPPGAPAGLLGIHASKSTEGQNSGRQGPPEPQLNNMPPPFQMQNQQFDLDMGLEGMGGMGGMMPSNASNGGLGMLPPMPGMMGGPGGMMGGGPVEQFHHVPPPNKKMRSAGAERFNPKPTQSSSSPTPTGAPQAAQITVQPPKSSAAQPSSGLKFVAAGQLSTTGQTSIQPAHSAPSSSTEHMPAAASAPQAAKAEAVTSPPADLKGAAPGAKPPGSHDHRGIGFAGEASGPEPQQPVSGFSNQGPGGNFNAGMFGQNQGFQNQSFPQTSQQQQQPMITYVNQMQQQDMQPQVLFNLPQGGPTGDFIMRLPQGGQTSQAFNVVPSQQIPMSRQPQQMDIPFKISGFKDPFSYPPPSIPASQPQSLPGMGGAPWQTFDAPRPSGYARPPDVIGAVRPAQFTVPYPY